MQLSEKLMSKIKRMLRSCDIDIYINQNVQKQQNLSLFYNEEQMQENVANFASFLIQQFRLSEKCEVQEIKPLQAALPPNYCVKSPVLLGEFERSFNAAALKQRQLHFAKVFVLLDQNNIESLEHRQFNQLISQKLSFPVKSELQASTAANEKLAIQIAQLQEQNGRLKQENAELLARSNADLEKLSTLQNQYQILKGKKIRQPLPQLDSGVFDASLLQLAQTIGADLSLARLEDVPSLAVSEFQKLQAEAFKQNSGIDAASSQNVVTAREIRQSRIAQLSKTRSEAKQLVPEWGDNADFLAVLSKIWNELRQFATEFGVNLGETKAISGIIGQLKSNLQERSQQIEEVRANSERREAELEQQYTTYITQLKNELLAENKRLKLNIDTIQLDLAVQTEVTKQLRLSSMQICNFLSTELGIQPKAGKSLIDEIKFAVESAKQQIYLMQSLGYDAEDEFPNVPTTEPLFVLLLDLNEKVVKAVSFCEQYKAYQETQYQEISELKVQIADLSAECSDKLFIITDLSKEIERVREFLEKFVVNKDGEKPEQTSIVEQFINQFRELNALMKQHMQITDRMTIQELALLFIEKDSSQQQEFQQIADFNNFLTKQHQEQSKFVAINQNTMQKQVMSTKSIISDFKIEMNIMIDTTTRQFTLISNVIDNVIDNYIQKKSIDSSVQCQVDLQNESIQYEQIEFSFQLEVPLNCTDLEKSVQAVDNYLIYQLQSIANVSTGILQVLRNLRADFTTKQSEFDTVLVAIQNNVSISQKFYIKQKMFTAVQLLSLQMNSYSLLKQELIKVKLNLEREFRDIGNFGVIINYIHLYQKSLDNKSQSIEQICSYNTMSQQLLERNQITIQNLNSMISQFQQEQIAQDDQNQQLSEINQQFSTQIKELETQLQAQHETQQQLKDQNKSLSFLNQQMNQDLIQSQNRADQSETRMTQICQSEATIRANIHLENSLTIGHLQRQIAQFKLKIQSQNDEFGSSLSRMQQKIITKINEFQQQLVFETTQSNDDLMKQSASAAKENENELSQIIEFLQEEFNIDLQFGSNLSIVKKVRSLVQYFKLSLQLRLDEQLAEQLALKCLK